MPKKREKWIIGVDEAGRGSLAGPVTVGVILAPANFARMNGFRREVLPKKRGAQRLKKGALYSEAPLRDSKKLTARQREGWFRWIKKKEKEREIFFTTANVFPKTIDRINISCAADRAAEKAIEKVIKKSGSAFRNIEVIYLDAGLRLNRNTLAKGAFAFGSKKRKLKTMVKADEKIPIVSLASIAAKVTRDSFMKNLDMKYPGYEFAINKGYGTHFHMDAIAKLGCSSVHRKTFLKFLRRERGIAKMYSI